MIPPALKYAESHEWASSDTNANAVTVGITEFAVAQLGDIVYLELPHVGDEVKQGVPFGEIESVKAASDLYAPISGTVLEVNDALPENLESFKTDAYRQSWLIKIQPANPAELDALMTAQDYENYLQTQQ